MRTHNVCFCGEIRKLSIQFKDGLRNVFRQKYIRYIEKCSFLVIFLYTIYIFIHRHTIVAGYYDFTLDVCVTVHPSIHQSVVRPSVCLSVHISFLDDNLSKHQWIFTKLGMCIDIVEIWFGIAIGQISSNFDGVISPRHAHIFISGR